MPAWEANEIQCQFKSRQWTALFDVVTEFDNACILAVSCASVAGIAPGLSLADIGDYRLRRTGAVPRVVSFKARKGSKSSVERRAMNYILYRCRRKAMRAAARPAFPAIREEARRTRFGSQL